MLGLLTGRAGHWIASAGALLAVLVGLWWLIDGRARLADENEDLRRQIEAWERVNDADIGHGDPADDLDWLRDRAGQR